MEGNNDIMSEMLLANRYKVLSKLGEGGMSKVWRVLDTVEQKEVALKQYYNKISTGTNESTKNRTKRIYLSTIVGSAESEIRFKQEFRTMVKLRHPNTVAVYNYGVLDIGDDYITMEIVKGKELKNILQEKTFSFPEIIKILIHITQVLNFIHSRLLVHRDIKSSNIIITPEGNIKMLDFGLMKQMGLPSKGEITGTIAYLPPEVAQGGIIDARSDLYSLGCLAYELVAGHVPFDTKSEVIAIIKKHINETPPSLTAIRPDIPEKLEMLISRLLKKNQQERFQSTTELLNELAPLSDEKITIETLEQKKSYLNCSELIGRENELKKLKDAIAVLIQGKGSSLFIAAPAGIGKSRLIQEFKLKAQLAEVQYVEGQCFNQNMMPYQPLTDAFKILLPLVSKKKFDKYGSILVKLFPKLKEKGYEPAPPLNEATEKLRLFDTVTDWLKEVAQIAPFILCIEDLHWSDVPTAELLNACIRGLKDMPVMIVGAFRDDEVEQTNTIFQTEEEGITKIIKLSTLSIEHTRLLITGMLGKTNLSDEFTNQIFTATGGNAFFISEIMRSLIEEDRITLKNGQWILPAEIELLQLPTTIEDTVTRRLNLLSNDALKLARIASVISKWIDLAFLKFISSSKEDQLFVCLDELVERQFMQKDEKQFMFTHDRVRETLYLQLSVDDRAYYHDQCGIRLEKIFAHTTEDITNELAYHYSRGIHKDKGIKYLIKAGKAAKNNNFVVETTEHLTKALELLEQSDTYPKKQLTEIKTRVLLLETSVLANPHLCIAIADKQFNLLSQMGHVKAVVYILRIFFKIVGLLPTKIADTIRLKLTQPKPLKEKLEGDYASILHLILRALGYKIMSLYIVGDIAKSLETSKLSFSYLVDFNSIGYGLLHASLFWTYGHSGMAPSYAKKVEKSIAILGRVEEQLSRHDRKVFVFLHYAREIAFGLLGLPLNTHYIQTGMTLCDKYNLLDIEMGFYQAQLQWYAFAGMTKELNVTLDNYTHLNNRLGRPINPSIFAYEHMVKYALGQRNMELLEKWNTKLLGAAKQINFRIYLNISRMYTAVIYHEKGNDQEALALLYKVVKFANKYKYIHAVEALYYTAQIHLDTGNTEKAKPILHDADTINKTLFEHEYMYPKFRILRAFGAILLKEKQFEEALSYYNKSLKIAHEFNNILEQALSYLSLAQLHIQLTQYTVAKKELDSSENLFETMECKYYLKIIQDLRKTLGQSKE